MITLSERSGDPTALEQISSLFELYCHDFTKTRKNERKYLLYHAVQYIVADTNYRSRSAYSDPTKIDRMTALINFIYQDIAKAGKEWESKGRNAELSQRVELGAVNRHHDDLKTPDLLAQNAEVIESLQNEIQRGGLADDNDSSHSRMDDESQTGHDVVKLFEKRNQQYDTTTYRQKASPDLHKNADTVTIPAVLHQHNDTTTHRQKASPDLQQSANTVTIPAVLQQYIETPHVQPPLPENCVYIPLAACNRVGSVAISKHETSRCRRHPQKAVPESRSILVKLAEDKSVSNTDE